MREQAAKQRAWKACAKTEIKVQVLVGQVPHEPSACIDQSLSTIMFSRAQAKDSDKKD